ncbi:hypothetical protein LPJ59_003818 [Coemansia sp. RSA 2399]|nr:hypothetical protein LPJ59_003818 [Coemansia sp. RSA 2399]KAJ1901438.1 hypothetical protein LPJ81_003751 [Coemansia sp. IMI 209127]
MPVDQNPSGDRPIEGVSSPTDNAFPEGDVTLTRTLREGLANSIRLGRGGNKARRGTTPRTSLVAGGVASHEASGSRAIGANQANEANGVNGTGSSTPSQTSTEYSRMRENNAERLEQLRTEALEPVTPEAAQTIPFRVKFVNTSGGAIFDDVYPDTEFEDIVKQVTEKLRMDKRGTYVFMYKDTDDEEIGVACTDNLREMFSLFPPGSRLQLRIAPFDFNNSGALGTIAGIWAYGQTPNIFVSGDGTPENMPSDVSEASTSEDIDITNIQLEMEERPRPTGAEDLAAAAAESNQEDIPSVEVEVETSAPGSANGSTSDADALRQAIGMMGANLALAIDSLGTKLTRNFDQLSSEQIKILDALKAAAECPPPPSPSKKTMAEFDKLFSEQTKILDAIKTAAECPPPPPPPPKVIAVVDEKKDDDDAASITSTTTTTTTTTTTKEEEKKEEDIRITVSEESADGKGKTEDVEITIEKKEEETVNEEIKVETTTTVKEEKKKKAKGDVKFSVNDGGDSDDETIHVEIEDEVHSDCGSCNSSGSNKTKQTESVNIKFTNPTPPAAPPSNSHGGTTYTEKIKIHVEEPPRHSSPSSYTPEATRAFAYHLSAANFAFHSNPYSSSFFKHGFAEADMPSHFSHPCMMASPFGNVCSCTRGRTCSACVHVNGH